MCHGGWASVKIEDQMGLHSRLGYADLSDLNFGLNRVHMLGACSREV